MNAASPVAALLGRLDIAARLDAAADALARLDERLARSPIAAGFLARADYDDATAALWLAGQAVHLHDLVLHDAEADIVLPTHDIVVAHHVLRTRRRISAKEPGSAVSPVAIASLVGRGSADADPGEAATPRQSQGENDDGDEDDERLRDDEQGEDAGDELGAAMAALDAAMARSAAALAPSGGKGIAPRDAAREMDDTAFRATGDATLGATGDEAALPGRDPLLYDPDRNEGELLEAYRSRLAETRDLPPILAAAIAVEAWRDLDPLQRYPWLGRLLAADLLRARRRALNHLPGLATGMRTIPFDERRQARTFEDRIALEIEAIGAFARAGLAEHERLMMARLLLLRRIEGRRSSSRLPQLVDLVLARPVVTAAAAMKALDLSPRGARGLLAELGLREMTGRQSWRAWGI